jgi:hypothetical protein
MAVAEFSGNPWSVSQPRTKYSLEARGAMGQGGNAFAEPARHHATVQSAKSNAGLFNNDMTYFYKIFSRWQTNSERAAQAFQSNAARI